MSTPGNGIACSTHSFFTSRDTTFSYLAKQWKKKKTKVSLAINKLSIMLTNFASKSFSAKKLSLSLSLFFGFEGLLPKDVSGRVQI